MKNILQSLTILTLIVFTGCYKDIDNSIPEKEIIPIDEVYIDTKISGEILDINNNKISGYSLLINNISYAVKGDDFLVDIKKAKQKGQTIYVTKNDEIIGFTTVVLVENDINQVGIRVFPQWETTHHHTDSKIVQLGESKLNITKAGFIDFNAQEYKGELTISFGMFSNENKITTVGYSDLYDLLVIQPLGGFYIDFSSNGHNIDIDSKNPLLLDITSVPNNTTGLFYFDKDQEKWLKVADIDNKNEITVSLKNDGYYVFGVHNTGIFTSGEVNFEGNPIAYQILEWENDQLSLSYRSSMKGKWRTILPENEDISITIKNQCGNIIDNMSIVTESIDIFEEEFSVIQNDGSLIQVNIEVIDCDGNPIVDPAIVINEDITYNFEGTSIDSWVSAGCGSVNIAAKSGEDNESGPSIPWDNESDIDIEKLSHCDELKNGYSYIKIDNETKIYESFDIIEEGGKSIFISNENNIKILIDGQEKGVYEEQQVNIFVDDTNFGNTGYYMNCDGSTLGCGITECVISQYDINGWTMLKISGDIWIQDVNTNKAKTLPIDGLIMINK